MSTEKSMDATAGLMDSQELDTNAASSSSSAPELKENVDTNQANSISSGGTVVQVDSDFKMEEMSNVKGNSNEVKVETTSSESSKNLECVRNVPNTGVESMEEGHTDIPSSRRHCTEELPLSSDNAEVQLDSRQVLVTRLSSSIVDDILNEQVTEDGSWQSIGNENSEERVTNGIVEEILEEAMDEDRVSNVEGLAQTLSSTNQELSSPRRSESDISLSEFINSPPLIYNTISPISPREEEFLLTLEPHRLVNNGMTATNPLVLVRRLSSSDLNQPHAEHEEQIESQQQQLLTTRVGEAEGEHETAPPEMEEEMMVPNEHGVSPSNIVENPNAIGDEEDDIETEDDGNDNDNVNDNDNESSNNVEENSDSRRPHLQYGYDFEYNRLRDLMVRTRRTMNEEVASYSNAAHFELAPRDSFMQRFRRILFILSSRRRRLIRLGLASPDVENGEDEPGADLDPDSNVTLEHFAQRLGMDLLEDFNETQAPVPSQRTEEEIPENAIRFDTNLPAEHSYMGNNMNRVCGVNYLDVGQQHHNMMLFMHHALLFPGEILPFMVSGSIINDDIDSQNGFLFGVCFPFLNDSANNENVYGVTCQIYEKGSDDRGNTLIKSRALQRFTTKTVDLIGPLEYISDHPQMKCFGSVEILPDVYLPEPLKGVTMGSLSRFRDIDSMQSVYKRYQAAGSPWPIHIYEYYETSSIIEKARTQLAQHKIDTMPTDPIQLSYWLVRNLHLPENLMRSIFLTNSVNVRLELISRTFKEESIFSCRYCSSHIANCRELFAMSKHGVQTQYCNSAGYIHETNTLYQVNVDAILYSGAPSTDFSWFPGYQWHVIICKVCKHHLGWEFKAVKPNLVPKQFYGISSSGIRVRSANIYARTRFNPMRAMMNGGGDASSDIEARDEGGDDIE